mgnify:CR=1 FL=1
MKDIVRRGTVSNVDYENGTVKVVYEDRDDAVSFDLPLLSFEFNPPQIGDMVIVIFLSNDTTQGFVIGKPFNSNNRPSNGKKNILRKDLDASNFLEYDKSTKTLTINVENVRIKGNFTNS